MLPAPVSTPPALGSGISQNKRTVLVIASIASFMANFDSSIVNLALPSIAKAFEASFADILLITTLYLLVIASLQTTFGRIGDMSGLKKVLILGLVIFTFGSFMAGLSGDVGQLILFRILQGIGSAMMSAMAGALVVRTYPPAERGRVLGITLGSVYAGLTVGPTAGGILVQLLGWRSIFYVNVPIGIATAIVAFAFIRTERIAKLAIGFDLPGAVTLTTFLVTMLLALSGLDIHLWELILLVISCLSSLVGFVLLETRKGSAALLDLRLFTQNRLFAAGNTTAFISYISTSGALLLLSVYLQEVLGLSPIVAGLFLLTQSITMAIAAPIAGALSDRIRPGFLSAVGMLTKAGAFFLLSLLDASSSGLSIWVPLMLFGLGHALFSSPNSNQVMSSVPHNQVGLASGTMGTIRSVSQSMGVVILGGIVAATMPIGTFAALSGGSSTSTRAAVLFITGMHYAFLLSAVICLIGIFTSLVRAKNPSFKPM